MTNTRLLFLIAIAGVFGIEDVDDLAVDRNRH